MMAYDFVKSKKPVGYIMVVVVLVLIILFWVDDVTVIGEAADPFEFLIISILGYYTGKLLKS